MRGSWIPAQVGQRASESLKNGLNDRVNGVWRGPTVAVSTAADVVSVDRRGAACGTAPSFRRGFLRARQRSARGMLRRLTRFVAGETRRPTLDGHGPHPALGARRGQARIFATTSPWTS